MTESTLQDGRAIPDDKEARSAAFVNWPVLYREMDRLQLDAMVGAAPQSIFYLTGTFVDTNLFFFDRLALVVVPRHGAPVFVVCSIEEAVVRSASWLDDIRTYEQYIESAGKLVEVLREKGAGRGRIGFEENFLSSKLYARIAAGLQEATLVAADEVIMSARARKMPIEVSMLQEAAWLSDESAHGAWEKARPGISEFDLAIDMTQEMLARGGHRVDHIYLGSGPHTQILRHKPDAKLLEPGEVFVCDFGAVRNMHGSGTGYWADLARMGVVGQPSDRQRQLYAVLRDVQRRIIERMRPGMRCCDLYTFARDAYLRAGADEVLPDIGHSMPRSRADELPLLQPMDTTSLEANMLFAVEPSFRAGTERYQVKDLVVVTDSGPRVLSDRWNADELFVLD